MTYKEVEDKAREVMKPHCRVCKVCDGKACIGEVPGTGGKGDGKSFTVCREFFDSVKINLDTLYEFKEIDTSVELFGKKFSVPFFAAPISGLNMNYPGYLTEDEYSTYVLEGSAEENSFAFAADGPKDDCFLATLPIVKRLGGTAVSTIKPWKSEVCFEKIDKANDAGTMAIAMDIDSAGLVNLKLVGKPVNPKSPAEMKEIISYAKKPFIVKGIMTAEAAKKCASIGAYAIVVSNHGGRVMLGNDCPAKLLPEIRKAVGNKIKIFVDGGIRTGADIYRCLALGADACLIGRPFVVAAHGGRKEGVKLYIEKIKAELTETMLMSNASTLKDITIDKIRY